MKLLLWCAWAASLQGTAVEAVYDEQKWLPTLGPNFDAAVTQVEALSHVASISKTFLGVCSDPDINTVPMYCHDELVAVLSSSRALYPTIVPLPSLTSVPLMMDCLIRDLLQHTSL